MSYSAVSSMRATLYNTNDNHNQDVNVNASLSRPRRWWILPILGILDLSCSINAITLYAHGGDQKDEWWKLLVAWNLVRASVVIVACSTVRIRQVGWIIVGSALISILSALAELNLFIQNRKWTSTSLSSFAYIISQLVFGLLHWLAFATIVGLRRPAVWREGTTRVDVSARGGLDENGAGESVDDEDGQWAFLVQKRRSLNDSSFASEDESSEDDEDIPIDEDRIGNAFMEEESEGELDIDDDDDDDDDGESENGYGRNDIIDIIPSPSTTRRRTSSRSRSHSHSHRSFIRTRHSFYRSPSNDDILENAHVSPVPLIAASSTYGTFRSLGGI